MLARLRQVAREQGLPFGDRRMTYNSRMAQEMAKWAYEQGREDAFHQAVFLAYFQRGENIARKPVLLKICAQAGLDTAAAEAVLDERTYRSAVDADWGLSRRMGITAVPTFVFGDQRLVGAQSFGALEDLLISGGARRRASKGQA